MRAAILNPPILPIQNKLIGMLALVAVGIITFLVFFYYSFSSSLENEKKEQSRHLSESAMGIIRYFHDLELSGQLTSVEAQMYTMNALQSARYGSNGYFWILSDKGEPLMHPFALYRAGTNLLNWKDVNGKYFFRNSVRVAKEGGGWISYSWPKPNSTEEYPKISYVAYFTPWNWILGTGLYLDEMKDTVFWSVFKASGVLLVSFIISIVILITIINYFVRQLSELAVRDALTNLYTKRFLDEITPSILNKHQRKENDILASIFMDIDHFKKSMINTVMYGEIGFYKK